MSKKIFLLPFLIMPASFLLPIVLSFTVSVPENPTGIKIQSSEEYMARLTEISDKTAEGQTVITVFNTKNNKTEEKYLEEYLCGVLMAEMPASYEMEALKAQAVAARSYIMSNMNGKNAVHSDAVVCTSASHCKGYLSLKEANEKWGEDWEKIFYPKIQQAVRETSGQYMIHNGEPVKAFFFALSNGKTENSEEVWGSALPYIESKDSSFDTSSPDFLSTAEVTVDEFNKRLENLNKKFRKENAPEISGVVLTEGGRVKSININGTKFLGTDIRSAFGLKSADFSVKKEGKKVIFTVKGNGHGVGMSQFGANCLAKNGSDYKKILSYYYKDIEIITK